ncbi:MAG: V-type ATP synthase subunit F [Clostridia bacterium]|nr:V-type ATP synthase subunit F [Clostridia bacterium]
MYKIAAIGDRNSIYGFASLGLSVYFIDDPHEARVKIKKLAEDDVAVIYITEELLSKIPEELERYQNSPLPVIIPIPGVSGNTGVGLKNVSRFVEQAVGSDILSDK